MIPELKLEVEILYENKGKGENQYERRKIQR